MPEKEMEDFRGECIAFLDANAPRRSGGGPPEWGEGSDAVAIFEELSEEEERAAVANAKDWGRRRAEAGLHWISGPQHYGGRGLGSAHERVYRRAEAQYDVPNQSYFGVGLGMVAPTVLSHGTELVRERYLAKMYIGEIIACQLFSEPGAGSDLAGVSTRATRSGDNWKISGQKVWTSGAHYSDIGEILCRTSPDAPKHKGLTAFIVDMNTPGVEVRRLRQMTGGSSFNEVFLDDVVVPDTHRLGEINEGWSVALTTLMSERASIGSSSTQGGLTGARRRMTQLLQNVGDPDDLVLRQQLSQLLIDFTAMEFTSKRAMAEIGAGREPGPEFSLAKMGLSANLSHASDFVSEVLGLKVCADSGEWGTYSWSRFVCGTPGSRIAGGTDEILRNIVAERVLGLPKEPTAERGARS
ncbi:MAG TPA: acyl-CoA dehydrogenase family protein [Mycobacterium sp.]|jgi:acyl-CoA dehydrogenase|nr:acyl-CoA dehydrogenase family protein [Mycobacterium sp.]